MNRWALLLVLTAASLHASPAAADMSGNVQFLVGQRWLDEATWAPVDQPPLFGIEVDFAPEGSPVHVALAGIVAGDSASSPSAYFGAGDIDVRQFEFAAGFLWLPVKKAVARPYLGAGVLTTSVAVGGDLGFFTFDDETDQSFGFYGNVGIFFKVGDTFNIGLDGRIVRGTKFELFGTEVDGDYEQASLLLGFSFGK